ncbi:DUF5050 domain-containing protein [Brevibacillus ruminantium]|uniref:DUF5050 domain-containing protein n=1 Tax=Brevibacillus ruminantium TaxID=2950604 RepID=UPI00389949A7
MKTDGTGKIKISDDTATRINVAGEWVFYWKDRFRENLYRVKWDGTDRQKVR